MIIVLGAIKIRPGQYEAALDLSLEHVRRSRTESGCMAHTVHRDTEDDQVLVFVEKWTDRKALGEHFRVSASRKFVQALQELSAQPPVMNVYEAEEIPY
jgi:quinol monooxygenase YgiN